MTWFARLLEWCVTLRGKKTDVVDDAAVAGDGPPPPTVDDLLDDVSTAVPADPAADPENPDGAEFPPPHAATIYR